MDQTTSIHNTNVYNILVINYEFYIMLWYNMLCKGQISLLILNIKMINWGINLDCY